MKELAGEGQKARELFIERNAIQAELGGLPRIAGRLIGIFLLDGGPISFSDLAERMQASRASVSTNTRLLERLGIIERVALRGERQDFFSLRANPFALAIEQSIDQCQRFSEYVDELLIGAELGEDAIERLRQAQVFHEVTAKTLQGLLATLTRNNWTHSREAAQATSSAENAGRGRIVREFSEERAQQLPDSAQAGIRLLAARPAKAKPPAGDRPRHPASGKTPRKP
ncbi:DNA-binding transcriptional regulator GbsR (MarR family) [Comamonas odontotermitis]|uniref:DNA-binding transcriptional regulator GbsR (MarR family) n=1 Tax=Comamonas odontotermitis TaxID=379895 RepID=A0ABR6RKQ8_9BURK|nr:MarR family transcriptional regulator [Comamonas odontotermitis]MBB6579753.1 DNA-binding transcriptional regulator GbsR (MarR family) [Comamonas odontotermitis]